MIEVHNLFFVRLAAERVRRLLDLCVMRFQRAAANGDAGDAVAVRVDVVENSHGEFDRMARYGARRVRAAVIVSRGFAGAA